MWFCILCQVFVLLVCLSFNIIYQYNCSTTVQDVTKGVYVGNSILFFFIPFSYFVCYIKLLVYKSSEYTTSKFMCCILYHTVPKNEPNRGTYQTVMFVFVTLLVCWDVAVWSVRNASLAARLQLSCYIRCSHLIISTEIRLFSGFFFFFFANRLREATKRKHLRGEITTPRL